jgi:hypothetical protein
MNPITIGSSSNVISAGFPVLWASLTAAASEKLDSRPNIFLNTAECVVRKIELTSYWIVVLPLDTSRSVSQSPLSTMLIVFSGGARAACRRTGRVVADAVAPNALGVPNTDPAVGVENAEPGVGVVTGCVGLMLPNNGGAVGVEITDCVGAAADPVELDPNKDVAAAGADALGVPNTDDCAGVDATDCVDVPNNDPAVGVEVTDCVVAADPAALTGRDDTGEEDVDIFPVWVL